MEKHILPGTPSGHTYHDLKNLLPDNTHLPHSSRNREGNTHPAKTILGISMYNYSLLKLQYKNTINNSQDNVSPLQPRKPMTSGPEYSNIVGTQDKDLKIVFMSKIEALKEKMSKSLKNYRKRNTIRGNE